jgi:hydrogenase maturation protein HypF
MRSFSMCADCGREYGNPEDRRFHAQPNACPACGPQLRLLDRNCKPVSGDPVLVAAQALAHGRIVAVRSIGGFQLFCDATDSRVVARLRRLKSRPAKSLALMCASVATIRRFCRVGPQARELLTSPAAPVVLMPKRLYPTVSVSPGIAPRNHCLGVMLPYTPLHHLLLGRIRAVTGRPPVLVATSANSKDEPIAGTEHELYGIRPRPLDLCLDHNRPIANRCDDSVVSCAASGTVMVRRSRGYAPQVTNLASTFHVEQPVLALGGDLRSTFCLAAGPRAYVSPHIGSHGNALTERFLMDTLRRFESLTRISARLICCDLHPDYASTRLARSLAEERGLPVVQVQHHVAHTAAVMAEHGLDEPVLGIVCDGTGYGTDGAIWGCELLLVLPDLAWTRLAHLGYLRLAGAADELQQPWRVARAYMAQAGHSATVTGGVRTSSLGRLFDAVAGITGVCSRATFDGEAAIALEAAADRRDFGHYFSPGLCCSGSPLQMLPLPILANVSRETQRGVGAGVVSARFHNTVVLTLVHAARTLCLTHGVRVICLSGGSFQNRLLMTRLTSRLQRIGFAVYTGAAIPVNDGGLSLGQAVAASRQRV